MLSIVSWEANGPAISVAGSPAERRVMKNVMVTIPKSSGIINRRRLSASLPSRIWPSRRGLWARSIAPPVP